MPVSVRPMTIQPITLRELRVLRVEDVTPTMRRVVLGGEQLGAFERDGLSLPEFVSFGFDDHVKLFFADPATGEIALPEQLERRIDWPKDPPPVARSYTVRRFDADAGEVTIDFAVHVAGVATAWSLGCAPGDTAWVAGPKMGALEPEGTDWLLLAGDETALPAIARCLEELPAGARAQVLVEVAGPESEQDLPTDGEVMLRWLHRGDAEPGTTTLLEDAVRELEWWPGEAFAWVAGETLTLRPIRRHLREDRGLPRERVDIAAYWRRREVEADEIPTEDVAPDDIVHEAGELIPPFAIRAAVTLGVGVALERGPRSTEALAATCGADAVALGKLLRYLAALGLLTGGPDGWALTPSGGGLHDEDSEGYDLRRPLARLDLAATGLLETVRTGRPAAEAVLGATVDALREDPALEAEWAAAAREDVWWFAPSFGEEFLLGAGERVLCCGDGVLALVDAALRSDPGPEITLLAPPSRAEAALASVPPDLRGRLRVHHGSELDGWPAGSADTVIVTGLLHRLADADAAHALRRAAAALAEGGRLLVAEEAFHEEGELSGEHEAEEDLELLLLHGSGKRTRAEWLGLFAQAGLAVEERSVGWGHPVFVLTPA